MARSLPPLTWFRSFEAAARHLSFTLAAQEIGMTQSAVSQQIKSLEMRLNTLLFRREARRLILTDEGRRLLPQIEVALGTIADATAGFDLPQNQSVLTIAASVSVIDWLISPRLSAFLATQKGLSVRFLSTIWPDDYQATRADVEIRFGSQKQVGHGARQLGNLALVPVHAADFAGDWRQGCLIDAVGTSAGWARFAQETGLLGLEEIQPRIFADSYGLALRLAADGQGVALVPSLLAQQAARAGSVVFATDASVTGKEGYYLARRADRPDARAFCGWLEQSVVHRE
ncbi:LysR family transcriptional regulator [Thalassobius sp. MITS945101]|uniref:LysR family transcriptional regulator n=1 Tax=Thalassobius sp. MITS945101 TaxID=3096994 RepID=UPI00399AAF85